MDNIPNTTSSLIDVLLQTTKIYKKNNTQHVLKTLLTDHNEISATIDIAKPKTKIFRTHKIYSKENL